MNERLADSPQRVRLPVTSRPLPWLGLDSGDPDSARAVALYQRAAPSYDQHSGWWDGQRERAVDLLELRPGDVVVDVGCGTGRCFPWLCARVAPGGRVVGIEPSIDMLEAAGHRIDREGWEGVDLVLGSAEDAPIFQRADAALFCFTHDVLRSPGALSHVLGHLRPGGRVAAVGPMWAPWWAPALNLLIWSATEPYVTTYEGFSAPWSHLAALIPDLAVERHDLSGWYFAWGTLPVTPLYSARGAHRGGVSDQRRGTSTIGAARR